MTCVVVLSINALMTYVDDDLYGYPFNQRLMTYVVDDLCGCPFNQRLMTYGRWPVWPMTCDLCGQ